MARGQENRRDDEEEKEDKEDVGVSDDALDLIDEDEDEDDFGMTAESDDDKGWE